MYYIKGAIVVEGNNDKSFLSSFISCEYVVTNGFDLDKNTVQYLKTLSHIMPIYVLTDPDDAGISISKKILEFVPEAKVVSISFDNRNNYSKHGIAETSKESVICKLKQYFCGEYIEKNDISTALLSSLNINNHTSRTMISDFYGIGATNNKNFVHRLNVIGVKSSDLLKWRQNYGN